MVKGNGKIIDEGLAALKAAFDGAQYLSVEAKECSERIQLGEHRQQNIPDVLIMEVYGSITAGRNIALEFRADSGRGFVAHLESYEDLNALMAGTFEAIPIEQPEAQT